MTINTIKAEIRRIEEAKAFAREVFPNTVFPNVVKQPVWFGRKTVKQAEGRIALVDTNNDTLFAIASERYNLILHEEIVQQVVLATKNLPEYGEPKFHINLPYDGAKMILRVNFPMKKEEVKVGDEIISEINFRSSYDLQWKLRSDAGLRRLICSNGASIPIRGKQFGYVNRHISTLNLETAIKTMEEGLVAYSERTGLWKQWAEKQIEEQGYNEIWEALPFSEAERKKMEELPETGSQILLPVALASHSLTLWDMHSVVTQFVTHNIESEARKADLEPKVGRVFDRAFEGRLRN